MSEPPDVQSSLEDMDRKLRELQQELALITRRPDPAGTPQAPPPPAFAPEPPPAFAPEPPPAFAPEPPPAFAPEPPARHEPPAFAPEPPQAFAPAPPARHEPPASAASYAAEMRAHEIVASARVEGARLVGEAAARVEAMGRQLDELVRVRDDLQRSAWALVEEYERAMRQGPPTGGSLGRAAPSAPGGGPAAAGEQELEGRVVVEAGPFEDIATLAAFERALGELPRAQEVYVRGLEGDRAVIELRLDGRVRLVEEMRRSLPFDFEVLEAGRGTVSLRIAPGGLRR